MATIPFATLTEADARSREWWTAILGRDKYPQDVTEFLYSRAVSESGDVTIEVADRDEHLDTLLRQDQMTVDEIAALVDLYPDYAVGVAYAVDDLIAYGGTLYRVVQAHTSQADWLPNSTPALYTHAAPAGTIPAWVQPTGQQDSYSLDELVSHNGRVWKSLTNANVYEPGVVGTWRDQSDPPLWVAPSGAIGLWQVNDVAEYNGQVWRNTSANNSFAPGVFGWTAIG